MCRVIFSKVDQVLSLESNLITQMYEAMLQEQIIPVIQKIVGRNLDDIYFQQQDGASSLQC